MRSLQSKFVVLILAVVMLCTMVIGGAGISSASNVLDRDAAKIMNLTCQQQAEALNELFSEIRISVDVVALYAGNQLESMERLSIDAEYREMFTEELRVLFDEVAKNTDGAIAYYVHYNPDFTPPTAGLFYHKDSLNGKFEYMPPTDLSKYEPTDEEYVNWYYVPVEKGEPTWMTPYWNKNLDVYMISYVVPVYVDNQLMGVVGMDIEFGAIQSLVEAITLYESGYAFLTDEQGYITTHKDLDMGVNIEEMDASLASIGQYLEGERSGENLYDYTFRGVEKKLAFVTLRNEMKLIITVPSLELELEKGELQFVVFVCGFVIAVIFILISITYMQKLIGPLKELTNAAERIAQGDMDIELHCDTNDELEVLTKSFQKTAAELKRNMDYINSLAYVDALTGIKNKTAYQELVKQLEIDMSKGEAAYAVVVLDVNGLKPINDEYGHEKGDLLIKNATRMICNVFAHSPVFRIGGDEFAVIMRNSDYERRDYLMEELVIVMADIMENGKEPWDCVSMAKGMACYDARVDKEFNQVFQRADKAMYENKAAMKAKMGIVTR